MQMQALQKYPTVQPLRRLIASFKGSPKNSPWAPKNPNCNTFRTPIAPLDTSTGLFKWNSPQVEVLSQQ